jgi:hypothetical protein
MMHEVAHELNGPFVLHDIRLGLDSDQIPHKSSCRRALFDYRLKLLLFEPIAIHNFHRMDLKLKLEFAY